jgi:hypothetical protein
VAMARQEKYGMHELYANHVVSQNNSHWIACILAFT